MRRWAQGQAAVSRWAALHTRIGYGKRLKIEMDSKRNGYGWRGSRKEGENNYSENGRRKRLDGSDILKSNNKRRILGTEWSMFKVGTPPPHNPEKTSRTGGQYQQQQIGMLCMKFYLSGNLYLCTLSVSSYKLTSIERLSAEIDLVRVRY